MGMLMDMYAVFAIFMIMDIIKVELMFLVHAYLREHNRN